MQMDCVQYYICDSGAVFSIFLSSLLGRKQPTEQMPGRLCDAQGKGIPLEVMQDMEIGLLDSSGKTVVLRERVAISHRVQQPTICFGRMLESGWRINNSEQALVHSAGANILIELQNKSVVVKGYIRALTEELIVNLQVRATYAEILVDVDRGRIGWELDATGCGIERRFGQHYQDLALVAPSIEGRRYRATLLQDDLQKWCVVEFSEPLDGLIDSFSEFHGYQGGPNILAFATNEEKDPDRMGQASRWLMMLSSPCFRLSPPREQRRRGPRHPW